MFSCFSKCFAIMLCLGRHKSTVVSWSVHIQMLFPTVAREIWIADRIMSLPYKIFSVSSFALRRKSKLLCRPKGLCHVSNNTSCHSYPQILSHNWLCKGHLRGTYLSLVPNPFCLPNIQFTSLKVFLCPPWLYRFLKYPEVFPSWCSSCCMLCYALLACASVLVSLSCKVPW